jgi:DNA-binding NtrC family response regulator
MERARVLVADDDADIRELLHDALTQWGYDVIAVGSGPEAVARITRELFDAALVDIWMPGMDGLQLLEEIKRHNAAIDVVMMTGDPMVSTAVQALKSGAYDYLIKPLNLDELHHLMSRLLEKRFLTRELSTLRTRLGEHLADKELVGASPQMARVKELVARVAELDSPVLIMGESGTGKELVASAIHRRSPRAKAPLVPVNCGAIPAELMESEFFGHVRGAFTGAVADALGLFRSANGGTLFLDEVAELPQPLQAKLLRVLEDKEIRPVGATKTHAVDVRIIAATNKDLEEAVRSGSFRQDLYYRLNVVRITMPPLRERKGEIPALVSHFLRRLNERFRRDVRGIATDALAALQAYDFPGNVRELENILESAYALGARHEIAAADLPSLALPGQPAAPAANESLPTLDQAERDLIAASLRRYGKDKGKAAQALGVTVRTFYRRLKKLGLA